MYRTNNQKINKDKVELNNITNQLDIIDIYEPLHPTTAEYIFFQSSYETFTKIGHILGNETLNKFKKLETICLLSNYNEIK